MQRKIYIASGLVNFKEVMRIRDRFEAEKISLTYDWAQEFEKHTQEIARTGMHKDEDLDRIARVEYKAVLESNLFILLCPGGRGAHFELGVAYSLGLPILILKDDNPIAFYRLPGIEIFDKEDDLFEAALNIISA